MEDRELIDRMIRGNQQAAAEFVRRYKRFVWKILRDCRVVEPEDAYQLVFLRLWENGGHRLRLWNGSGNFCSYLATITRNVAMDTFRRDPAANTGPADTANLEQADPAPGPEDEVLQRERRGILRERVQQLPPEDQHLFRQFFLTGKTAAEIAAELGILRNAVDQRIHQLRRKIIDSFPHRG